ncbi:MAG: hypothetical protein AAGG51_10345 [Cyanobacteria bacterium P01_G01_bin.54]
MGKLQATLKNQDTALGQPVPVQPQLAIGQPHDPYEQEADCVAAQVVKQINKPIPFTTENRAVQPKSLASGTWATQPGITTSPLQPQVARISKIDLNAKNQAPIQCNRPEDFNSYKDAEAATIYSQKLLKKQKSDTLEEHIGAPFTTEEINAIYTVNRDQSKDNEIHSDSNKNLLKKQDTKVTPHVDHRFPKAKGGSNSFTNAAVLSAASNIAKSDKGKIKQEPDNPLKPYKNLKDSDHNIIAGGEFSAAQKKEIYEANKAYYGKGKIVSDEDGKTELEQYDSSSVPHVDHITPKSKEGSSYFFNAQVLSAEDNIQKGGSRKKKRTERYGWLESQMTLEEYYQYKKGGTVPERIDNEEEDDDFIDEEPVKKRKKKKKVSVKKK